jgi:hypothetical protein
VTRARDVGVEADAVVGDLDDQRSCRVVGFIQPDVDPAGLGVLDGVVQRLLNDAEELLFHALIEWQPVLGSVYAHLEPLPGRDCGRVPADGRDQPLLVERSGPQLEDQRPHLGQRALRQFSQLS